MIDDLKKGALFAALSEEHLKRVAGKAKRVRLKQGQSLFEQGDPAQRFYLVLKGQVKLYRLSPAGNEKVIEVVTAGSTFAEALMFLDRPSYPVGALALAPSEVISVDARDFADMLRGSVDACFLLLGDMSQRLRGLIREIDALTMHSAVYRVAGYLLSQAEREAQDFQLKVPKQVLASRLSVKPETFSRIVRDLTSRGIISVNGNRVSIIDRTALSEVADVCALPADPLQSALPNPCPER